MSFSLMLFFVAPRRVFFFRRESGKEVGTKRTFVSPFLMASRSERRRGWSRFSLAAILAERRSGPECIFLFLLFVWVEALGATVVESVDKSAASRGGVAMGDTVASGRGLIVTKDSYGGLRGGEGGGLCLSTLSFLMGAAGAHSYKGSQWTLLPFFGVMGGSTESYGGLRGGEGGSP